MEHRLELEAEIAKQQSAPVGFGRAPVAALARSPLASLEKTSVAALVKAPVAALARDSVENLVAASAFAELGAQAVGALFFSLVSAFGACPLLDFFADPERRIETQVSLLAVAYLPHPNPSHI